MISIYNHLSMVVIGNIVAYVCSMGICSKILWAALYLVVSLLNSDFYWVPGGG